jgi:ribonuclease E
MANKMLIDATHPEETRVVVLRGNRVEEFDFETAHRKQLRGNIYLAKVTRVEPSLQAAFIEYGGNRHGFLAFSEIHPDYYQIPVADRQALIDEDARQHRDDDEEHQNGRRRERHRHRDSRRNGRHDEVVRGEDQHATEEAVREAAENPIGEAVTGESPVPEGLPVEQQAHIFADEPLVDPRAGELQFDEQARLGEGAPGEALIPEEIPADALPLLPADASSDFSGESSGEAATETSTEPEHTSTNGGTEEGAEDEVVESVGGADAMEEMPVRAPRYRRQYKIQEVIKRRQVMLVQVVKEERGTKGAALTTYLSLAGRYCVLMPNTARGGGISRKITSAEDRKRLREIADELEVPEGMGVILRTAGANRNTLEVKRDFEYLLRQWELVRDLTLKSTAPTLVYEEGSLIKRSIRDLYGKEIDEIVVAGEAGYNDAKDFMRMLMPSHASNVKLYRDSQPIFTRYGIESQLDAMFSPTVQLKSGGYIVLNQTEALVSIDVNSGRSTREHHIEDTALKTNVEAAEEVARQLRLRDLAGLIVIDFIDMDEKRNNRTVERRLKDALKNDRARIQVGRISHFGLMEMSRQRIRTSVLESSTEKCPHCGGSGHVRSVSSVALQLLRSIEETILKGATHNLIVRTRPEIALYVLNNKRAHLRSLEERFHITITVSADATIGGQVTFAVDRGEQVNTIEQAKVFAAQAEAAMPPLLEEPEPEIAPEEEEFEIEDAGEVPLPEVAEAVQPAPFEGEREGGDSVGPDGVRRRRRRRRRGRGGQGREQGQFTRETVPEHVVAHEDDFEEIGGGEPAEAGFAPPPPQHQRQPGEGRGEGRAPGEGRGGEGEHRRRRRGRRGGRRNKRERENFGEQAGAQRNEQNGGQRDEQFRSPQSEGPEQPYTPQFEPRAPEPAPFVAAPAMPPPPPSVEPEPPRRRSTVREPAPVFSNQAAESSQPVTRPAATAEVESASATSGESETANKPRRTGWWAKRLLGGKD